MIMPSKIVQPVDSLISISASILKILNQAPMNIDDLHEEVNKQYYKSISIEKLLLCLDFLYIVNKIKDENEIVAISIG